MRKRTIKYCFDTLLWGILTLLPLILYLIYVVGLLFGHRVLPESFLESNFAPDGTVYLTFDSVLTNFGFFQIRPPESGILYNAFFSLFGGYQFNSPLILDSSGVSFVCFMAQWIINIQLLHIAVDFILILPRICRKFLDRFKSEDC